MIPAIDLLAGRAVFLTGGERGTEEVVADDPVVLAREWQRRGARRLHVVDLDAAIGSGENRDVVRRILRAVTVPVQAGGGLRDEPAIRDVLAAGASWAIVGTRAVREPEWVRAMAVRFPSRLILALDRDERGVLVEGWKHGTSADPAGLVELANRVPLAGVLFTNVAVEGRLGGVGDVRDNLVERCSRTRIAAGGATTLADLQSLRAAGFDHVVVGKALLAGSIPFERAQEAMA